MACTLCTMCGKQKNTYQPLNITIKNGKLTAYINEDNYIKKFGNTTFSNLWIEKSEPLITIYISEQKGYSISRIMKELYEGEIHGDKIHENEITNKDKKSFVLSSFYFHPREYGYNKEKGIISHFDDSKTQSESIPLFNIMTDNEKKYFKGFTHTILCEYINVLICSKKINDDDQLVLQAAGNVFNPYFPNTDYDKLNKENMIKLISYYESIGFQTCFDYRKHIDVVSSVGMCMYGKISKILDKCKPNIEKSKKSGKPKKRLPPPLPLDFRKN